MDLGLKLGKTTKAVMHAPCVSMGSAKNNGLSFTQLPPEIRIMIYKKFFPRQKAMRIAYLKEVVRRVEEHGIVTYVQVPGSLRSQVSATNFYEGCGVSQGTLLGHKGISILLANKLIYQEVLPYLYRSHIFVFKDSPSLAQFATCSGPGFALITSLSLQSPVFWTTPNAAPALAHAKSLKRLYGCDFSCMSMDEWLASPSRSTSYVMLDSSVGIFIRSGRTVAERRRRFSLVHNPVFKRDIEAKGGLEKVIKLKYTPQPVDAATSMYLEEQWANRGPLSVDWANTKRAMARVGGTPREGEQGFVLGSSSSRL